MIIFGIVSEYNPMHYGHIYQIERIKKHFPEAYIVSLTSGSFVQRGEPSFISKHSKSIIAVENGVDLVLEMPSIISIQSANYFSFYSVKLLNKLNILTHISFGTEDLTENEINDYLDFSKNNQEIIDLKVSKHIDSGLSYKKSYELALKELSYINVDKIAMPNNTLAIQYMRCLKEMNSSIKPFVINRKDTNYHDDFLNHSKIQSATAIRKSYAQADNIEDYIPFNLEEYKSSIMQISLDSLKDIFYYKAFVKKDDPSDIAGYENGMLNLLVSNFNGSLEEMVEKSTNKRYSKSRLKRFILNYLLEINNNQVKMLDNIDYIRPLKFNSKGADLLRLIKSKSSIEIINKVSDSNNLDDYNKSIFDIDLKAFRLYNLNSLENDLDYKDNPYMGE